MTIPRHLDAHGSRLFFEDEDGEHIVDFSGMCSTLKIETAIGLPAILAELYNNASPAVRLSWASIARFKRKHRERAADQKNQSLQHQRG